MKNRLSILGFATLAAVAAAGWMRQPTVRLADVTANLQAPSAFAAQNSAAPQNSADVIGDAVYREAPVTRSASHRHIQSVAPLRTVADRYSDRYQSDGYQSDRYRSDRYQDGNYRYEDRNTNRETYSNGSGYSDGPAYRRERSTQKSAAIIAGGAVLGAAIGGMAGHGKGAAIGALSGGALATVYDRMTHKKTDGWGWHQ